MLFLLYINDLTVALPPRTSNTLHADDLAEWTSAEHTTTATYIMQNTVNNVSNWAKENCMEINCSKTQATLFSLSTTKENTSLKLNEEKIPQVDNPKFLGVTLDTRLTWKPHLEATAAKSTRKLSLLKKLAGTTWGADGKILNRVYTGAVRPIMEYATTSWATASNTNKAKLDRVQNIALRAITGGMKTTPIKEMQKRADIEPLENRRELKVLTQTEKLRRLPSHPMHKKLSAMTKNRLKRKSLNHLTKDLRKKESEILDQEIKEESHLSIKNWNQTSETYTIELEVPGLYSREEQHPAQEKSTTLEMLNEKYPSDVWTHIYTDGSADDAVKNGGSGVFIKTTDGQKHTFSNATGKRCSNFKAETLALQTAISHIITTQPEKSVILSDSKAALQSLSSDSPDRDVQKIKEDLHSIPPRCTVVLQWIPAHCGISGNEEADQLAKNGSKMIQPNSTTTYREAKTLLKNKRKTEWRRSTDNYNPKQDPINNLKRNDQTAIFRLRTGHCSLRSHLKRIGVSPSALCDCGAEQTVHHILQDCPKLEAQRRRSWAQEVPTSTKLYGTANDLRCTVQVLAACRVRV